MINCDTKPLYDRLETVKEFNNPKDSIDKRLVLSNYASNVYGAIMSMGDVDVNISDSLRYINTNNYKKFVKGLNKYNELLIDNYLANKEFHKNYLEDILPFVEEELDDLFKTPVSNIEEISEDDFFTIIYMFLESINLDGLFDELYNNCHIHSALFGQEEGFTLCNPLTKDVDLVVNNLKFDITSMNTLMHELGHGYDLKKFNGSIEEYNRYFYSSFYGEVISRLMERLLHRFLIKNDIYVPMAKEDYINCLDLFHDNLLLSYIISLLDDSFIKNSDFNRRDYKTIVEKVRKNFLSEEKISSFLNNVISIDLSDTYTYAYGDIISMFLVDEVESVGMTGKLFDCFMRNRSNLFDREFFKECSFGSKNYIKLYKKEADFLKK